MTPPILFNPLKHHLGFMKEFIAENPGNSILTVNPEIVKELKHIGGSVMDIYTGNLSYKDICNELRSYLLTQNLIEKETFKAWAGSDTSDYKVVSLSDNSQWTLKYQNNDIEYVHVFPARYSPHSFRVKANTLKSAILYLIIIDKDFVNEDDLNTARAIVGLSPIKDIIDSESITEMIEILRR